MPEVQVASSQSVVSVVFDLETALLQSHLYPLKSHLTIQSLCYELQACLTADEPLQQALAEVISALERVIEAGGFLNEPQRSDLFAWVTTLRSVWVAQQSFVETVDYEGLQALQKRFVGACADLNKDEVKRYTGEYSGPVTKGFAGFASLSDLGYWAIDHARNRVQGAHQQSDVVAMSVVLETGLCLAELAARLPDWRWQSALESNQPLSLSPDSENYWVDWLHTMAAEREVWRRSASFLQFYKSLQTQVREQFSVALDQLYEGTFTSNIWVIPAQHHPPNSCQFDLYGGRVYLLDEADRAQQVLALSESVIPVYVLSFAKQSFVVPAFRAQLLQPSDTDVQRVWQYDGGWHEQVLTSTQSPLVQVRTLEGHVCLQPTAVTRDYGVVLRSTCLPCGTRNIWRVRDEFQQEPIFANEQEVLAKRQWRAESVTIARPKNHTPVYFQLTDEHGIELFADMVVGLQPYGSLEWVMPGLIYHAGQVMPLIEPQADACHRDDMVMMVAVRGSQFAFRGRYSLDKQALHKLVDGDTVVLTWQNERINISFQDRGWLLLDQRHTYLFHKQLLEIFKYDGCE
ncbi:hypothetical protein MAQ5080_00144 [Marinomonas aquimarina]|uniref:Uncharacterized protein n=1 Tax=Marinomonas aquimarina TaxID=295068 RepID=A0A1A8SZM6_9GAMM|nr:hypothetical protein [Marinomonas aquimarina]SBS24944.1 hypothetical protein MAQ5080_00144 [Marinomonas aquimarina]